MYNIRVIIVKPGQYRSSFSVFPIYFIMPRESQNWYTLHKTHSFYCLVYKFGIKLYKFHDKNKKIFILFFY